MIPFSATSYWEKVQFLDQIDYLILGSGIVGLSTALHLKMKAPKAKVVVLERGYLPTGASTKNAGFVCIGCASELLDDISTSSREAVFNTVQKRWEGLHYLKGLLGEDKIQFLKLGSHELFAQHETAIYTESLNSLHWLNDEMRQLTGIDTVFESKDEALAGFGFHGFKHVISSSAEGQLNTGKMMQALLQKAQSLGVLILNGIEVKSIHEKSITCNYGNLSFQKLAICNNGLAAQFLAEEDVQPARAQVVVTSPIKNLKVEGIYHFDKGYYYFRNIDNRVLLGGGRNLNFKAEETDELNTSDQIINHLSALLETQILPNSAFTIDYQWAGTMGVGREKAPIIKKLNGRHFCAVRLGGMGVAMGSLVGKELSELMG